MAKKQKVTVTETVEDEQDTIRAGGPGSGSWDGPGQPRFAAGPQNIEKGVVTGAKLKHEHDEASREFGEEFDRALALHRQETGGIAYQRGNPESEKHAVEQHNVARQKLNERVQSAADKKEARIATARKEYESDVQTHIKSLSTGGSGAKDSTPDLTPVCRALNASAIFDKSADARFMWMPAGHGKELHLTYDDKPAQLWVSVVKGDEATVQASFDALCEKAAPQKPFCDIEHQRKDASAWPIGFDWSNQDERDGIYVRAEWSGLGKEHVEKKIHRSFSPSFKTDAEWTWDKDGQRYFCAAGSRGSKENPARITGVGFDVGTLTNQPAFKDMQPLFAKENESAANTNTTRGGEAAVRGDTTMTDVEIAAQKAADKEKLDAALARAKTAEDAIATASEEAVDAAILRAVERGAIEPKDEEGKTSYKTLGKTSSKSVITILDKLPAKANPGTTRAIAHTDDKTTRGVTVGECSFEDAFRGWTGQMAPQNKLIREGNMKEAVRLSRASSEAYADLEKMISGGSNVSMPDMIARAVDVTTVVDGTYGTLSGLLLVLQRNLGFLKNRLPLLTKITTDFRNEPALYEQWVRTRYLTYPTVYDYTAPTFSGTTPSSSETQKTASAVTDVDVKIDKNKRVWVPIDTAVLSGTVRNLFQEQRAPGMYALADKMTQDLVYTIINGTTNAGGTTNSFSTTAAQLAIVDANDVQKWVPAIGLKADVAKMPDVGRYIFMHSAYWRGMESDRNFAQLQAIAYATSKTNPVFQGDLDSPFGFNFEHSQLMTDNATYTSATVLGFVGTKESLILVGRIPQDYTQAIEAPPTATIQILTEPETGLSIMVSQFVNNNLETANLRIGIMYGTAVGLKTCGFLVGP